MVQIPPISFISSYFVNVFLCARLHVRSLSNIKAYIHHRACVRAHACLWRTWPHYFSRGYCLFCVSLTRAERVVHKLSACKCTEWHKLNGRNTCKEVLQPSLKCGSTTFLLATASGRTELQVEEPNWKDHTWSAERIFFEESLIPVTHTCV